MVPLEADRPAQGTGEQLYVPDPAAEWFALFDAECVVELEALALAALRDLSTEQIRNLRWVGLLDDGWRRMTYVLAQRGEEL